MAAAPWARGNRQTDIIRNHCDIIRRQQYEVSAVKAAYDLVPQVLCGVSRKILSTYDIALVIKYKITLEILETWFVLEAHHNIFCFGAKRSSSD